MLRNWVTVTLVCLAGAILLIWHFSSNDSMFEDVPNHGRAKDERGRGVDSIAIEDDAEAKQYLSSSDSAVSETAPESRAAVSIRTSRELQGLIDARPDDPDVFFTSVLTLDLCDDERLEKSVSMESIAEYARGRGNEARANYIDSVIKRFCDHRLMLPYPEDSLSSGSAAFDHFLSLAPQLQGLLSAAEADEESGSGQGSERNDTAGEDPLDVAIELMATTPSHFVFDLTGRHLIENGRFNAFMRRIGYDDTRAILDDEAGSVMMLASCRIFAGCGPEQFVSVHRCILGNCNAPMAVEQIVQMETPPARLPAVQRAAQSILSLRQR